MSLSFDHSIKDNNNNERPTHVIFADVESKLSSMAGGRTLFTPFLWTMIYRGYRRTLKQPTDIHYHGTDINDFWDHVEKHTYKRAKTYLVTHHLEVDFMPMKGFTSLMGRGWSMTKLISHARVLIMWWKKETRTLIVMNNGNLFDGSIEAWGKVFGSPKLTMPAENAPLSEWVPYCAQDTKIMALMWDNLLEFMDKHDLGNFKLSKASLAMGAFRHRFMTRSISIHNHPEAISLERDAYKGGRFEALQVGYHTKGPYYCLDINSMYGQIMRDQALPYELRGYYASANLDQLKRRMVKYGVIAAVRLRTTLPILPLVVNHKVVYQTGDFNTTLSTPELRYYLDQDLILEVGSMAWYYQGPILHDYAAYFLTLKDQYDKEGNQPMRQVTKLFLNSLYGKFGQLGYEDKIIGDCDPSLFQFIPVYNADTGARTEVMYYGGKIHETVTTPTSYNTLTAIAAHITAYGRLELWGLMQQAGLDHVYHVATDSLVVDQAGYDNLADKIKPGIPGYLKVEGTFNEYTVKGPNDTIQGLKIKVKGIPPKAIKLSENKYVITEWPKLTTLLKDGVTDYYYTRSKVKILHRDPWYKTLGTPNPDLKAATAKPVRPGPRRAILDPEVNELMDRLEYLQSERLISAQDMFRLWDYRHGTFKRVRNLNGNLVRIEDSDEHRTAWGYKLDGLDDLIQAVKDQVKRDYQINVIKARIQAYKRTGYPSITGTGEHGYQDPVTGFDNIPF
jgi:hypothetical protein